MKVYGNVTDLWAQKGIEMGYPGDSDHRIPEQFPSLRQEKCPTRCYSVMERMELSF